MSGASATVAPSVFSWSYSALKNYETCPRRFYHYNVAKDVTEPETPALREGHALHMAFRLRLSEGKALPMGMTQHETLLRRFVDAPGTLHVEQKLALTSTFGPTGYFAHDTWFRTVIDACTVRDDGIAAIADWKTGRNKPDDTQLQLMAAAVFAHSAGTKRIRAALVFVNENHIDRAEFARDDLAEIWGGILPRVKELENARQSQHYPPQPGGLCKAYCAVTSCEFHGRK